MRERGVRKFAVRLRLSECQKLQLWSHQPWVPKCGLNKGDSSSSYRGGQGSTHKSSAVHKELQETRECQELEVSPGQSTLTRYPAPGGQCCKHTWE